MDNRACIGNHGNSVIVIRVCDHAFLLLSRQLIIILLGIHLISAKRLDLARSIILTYVEAVILHIRLEFIRFKQNADTFKVVVIHRRIPRSLPQVYLYVIIQDGQHPSIDTALAKRNNRRIRRHYCL